MQPCRKLTMKLRAVGQIVSSRLEKLDTGSFRRSKKLPGQAGQWQASPSGEVQVGGIVNSEAVLPSEGEFYACRGSAGAITAPGAGEKCALKVDYSRQQAG